MNVPTLMNTQEALRVLKRLVLRFETEAYSRAVASGASDDTAERLAALAAEEHYNALASVELAIPLFLRFNASDEPPGGATGALLGGPSPVLSAGVQ